MPRIARPLVTALVALMVAALSSVVLVLNPGGAAAASKAPYSDPNAVGYLGFCNEKNQQITSGSIDARPFVYKVVSSAPAPAKYGPPYGAATLYAFQPIQYVDPSNWSGKQLTAASAFSNSKAPMTVATIGDSALVDFSSVFPLHYQDFAQLRFYFTARGQVQFTAPYPAADVQITGNTWKQVGGGKVNCSAGQVISHEVILGTKTNAPTTTPHPTGTQSGSLHSSGSSGPVGSGASGASGGATSPASASSNSSSGSDAGVIIGVVLAVLVVGGGGSFLYRRRRGSARS